MEDKWRCSFLILLLCCLLLSSCIWISGHSDCSEKFISDDVLEITFEDGDLTASGVIVKSVKIDNHSEPFDYLITSNAIRITFHRPIQTGANVTVVYSSGHGRSVTSLTFVKI